MESNMNFTGVLKSALNWFPTQEGRWVINGHRQTLKIWPQSHRIPAFHVEGQRMLNYRNHNLNRSNVGLKELLGLADSETKETCPLLKVVRSYTWFSSNHSNKFYVAVS